MRLFGFFGFPSKIRKKQKITMGPKEEGVIGPEILDFLDSPAKSKKNPKVWDLRRRGS